MATFIKVINPDGKTYSFDKSQVESVAQYPESDTFKKTYVTVYFKSGQNMVITGKQGQEVYEQVLDGQTIVNVEEAP